MGRPSKRKTNTAKILKAALDLIASNGFQGSPMSLLSKKASVSVGTIYLYYRSKDEVVQALHTKIHGDLEAIVLQDFDSNNNFKENFGVVFDNISGFFREHPKEFRFMEQFGLSRYQEGQINMAQSSEAALQKVIAQGREENSLRAMSDETMMSMVYGPLIAHLHKFHSTDADAKVAQWEELRDACFNAVSLS